MLPLTEIGLLVLYVCAGAAAVILAHSAMVRVGQLGREYRSDAVLADRHMRLKEREADLKEQEIANDRRGLDLRERELAMEEDEHRKDEF